jgi:hypothetical protein
MAVPQSVDEFKRLHGDWASMSIHLGNGVFTLPPAPDGRLTRIVQAVSDLAGKPFNELRVLDLACAEGRYASSALCMAPRRWA